MLQQANRNTGEDDKQELWARTELWSDDKGRSEAKGGNQHSWGQYSLGTAITTVNSEWLEIFPLETLFLFELFSFVSYSHYIEYNESILEFASRKIIFE